MRAFAYFINNGAAALILFLVVLPRRIAAQSCASFNSSLADPIPLQFRANTWDGLFIITGVNNVTGRTALTFSTSNYRMLNYNIVVNGFPEPPNDTLSDWQCVDNSGTAVTVSADGFAMNVSSSDPSPPLTRPVYQCLTFQLGNVSGALKLRSGQLYDFSCVASIPPNGSTATLTVMEYDIAGEPTWLTPTRSPQSLSPSASPRLTVGEEVGVAAAVLFVCLVLVVLALRRAQQRYNRRYALSTNNAIVNDGDCIGVLDAAALTALRVPAGDSVPGRMTAEDSVAHALSDLADGGADSTMDGRRAYMVSHMNPIGLALRSSPSSGL